MKNNLINENNWGEVKAQIPHLLILPWGATEPHNYHLPYGTDSMLATKISELSAAKAYEKGVICGILPVIPLGVQNPGQFELAGCLHVKPSTQIAILNDILWSISQQGIDKLLIMNGHGGNDIKTLIRELQPNYPNLLLTTINYWTLGNSKAIFDEPGDHAGELETSLMLHFYPDLVDLSKAGTGEAGGFALTGLQNKTAWMPRNWSKVSKDTGIGNPAKATAKKGELFANEVSTIIAEFLVEFGKATWKDIYQSEG